MEVNLNIEKLEADISSLQNSIDELTKNNTFNESYRDAIKKLDKLNTVKNTYSTLNNKLQEKADLEILISDPEMSELAKEDLPKITAEVEILSKTLEKLTVVPLENDEAKAIFEIRPGVGGLEASLFADELYRMYIRYCNVEGYRIEQFSIEYDELGGIKEAIFLVDEPDSFGHFRFESGVHRVQRVPVTESAGRIHTSTASVVVMPQFEKTSVEIKAEDIRIDVFRAGGPGGQSVNTTDSAVRITHLPTKIVISCQAGKSQHKNREMALSILASKLEAIEREKKSSIESKIRSSSIQGGDRSAKIRTYNFPQGRVTDHRIQHSWFNIDQIMEGYVGDVITMVSATLRKEIHAD